MPISGRKVLLASCVIVVATAGVAGWFMYAEKPKAGAYIDAVALEGDFVVGIRRETTRDRAFVELIALGEGMRWQALIPSYVVPDGAVGIAASEHAITVRFPRDGHTQVWGFAAQSAKKLGSLILEAERPGEPDGMMADGAATLSGGALAYEILRPDGEPLKIDAVSLERGSIAWKQQLPESGLRGAWVTGDHLVIDQGTSVTALARDGSTMWTAPSTEATCVVPAPPGGDDLVIVRAGDGVDLVDVREGKEVRREHVALEPYVEPAGQCGRRRDRIVFTANIIGTAAIVAVRSGSTEKPQVLKVGPGVLRPGAQRASAPLSEPFAGALGAVEVLRLEPDEISALKSARLVGVDLDRMQVAWESSGSELLAGALLIDAGATVLIGARGALATIDPAKGVGRGMRLRDATPLQPHHVAGGTVWVVGPRGLIALDTATLTEKGHWRTAPDVDIDASVLADLGLVERR
jgi:hypothetical protein